MYFVMSMSVALIEVALAVDVMFHLLTRIRAFVDGREFQILIGGSEAAGKEITIVPSIFQGGCDWELAFLLVRREVFHREQQ